MPDEYLDKYGMGCVPFSVCISFTAAKTISQTGIIPTWNKTEMKSQVQ